MTKTAINFFDSLSKKKKVIYKQAWFWLTVILGLFVVLSSAFYIHHNKPGVSKTNYNKIKISSHKYGKGGTSLAEAKQILGDPIEISSPNRIDYKQSQQVDEPVYYDVKWRDARGVKLNSAESSDSTNDYGVEKGTIQIKFASQSGNKTTANAISKDENI